MSYQNPCGPNQSLGPPQRANPGPPIRLRPQEWFDEATEAERSRYLCELLAAAEKQSRANRQLLQEIQQSVFELMKDQQKIMLTMLQKFAYQDGFNDAMATQMQPVSEPGFGYGSLALAGAIGFLLGNSGDRR